ncbi:MAG: 50S ribosomal protein L28 [Limnochordia bacterium]|jgi:large subunit ribosomal protein L28|nr:50S ribosomal protein L28 [Bacillota bacterium]
MARRCTVCGKGTETGNNISHSNVKTRRRWKANLQRIRILDKGVPRRAYVCTKCIKSGKVARAM